MDKSRRKVVVSEWRPVSTQSTNIRLSEAQSSSHGNGGSMEKDLKVPGSSQSNNKGKSVDYTEKHSLTMEVGASLMRFIKGKWGETQKKLEEEFKVQIKFPSSRLDDNIVIEGNISENLNKAAVKIQTLIDEVVKSPNLDYSHFISLPLAIYPELIDKLFNFQNSILMESESNEELGIEKSIFIKPKTFHLTVLMLKLWNKDRVKTASQVLQNVSSKVEEALNGKPLYIRLKGLKCMRPPLAKARVLYLPVEEIGEEDRLKRACQVIIDAFIEAGLVLEKDAQQKLLLHATVMNARHRKRNTGVKRVDSFDARGIMETYGSEEWGEFRISEAHLSQRFVFDEHGYYHCCGSIPFPQN